MLFYIKTCLKFTVKGTSDPDAAENCTTFIKCADFTNRQSIHFNFRMVKGILNYFMYGFFLYLPVYINMLPTLSNRDNKSQNCLKDNSVELQCETNV